MSLRQQFVAMFQQGQFPAPQKKEALRDAIRKKIEEGNNIIRGTTTSSAPTKASSPAPKFVGTLRPKALQQDLDEGIVALYRKVKIQQIRTILV